MPVCLPDMSLAVLELMVELPFAMGPIEMDQELEAARVRLVLAYERMREVVLRAYGLGYTVARISALTGLRLETVVGVVRTARSPSVSVRRTRAPVRVRRSTTAGLGWP